MQALTSQSIKNKNSDHVQKIPEAIAIFICSLLLLINIKRCLFNPIFKNR